MTALALYGNRIQGTHTQHGGDLGGGILGGEFLVGSRWAWWGGKRWIRVPVHCKGRDWSIVYLQREAVIRAASTLTEWSLSVPAQHHHPVSRPLSSR